MGEGADDLTGFGLCRLHGLAEDGAEEDEEETDDNT
jgi:hypothetical protein